MSSQAENAFYTFWFEKNLQGDIVAVYNESGVKILTYSYDAWGNCTEKLLNIAGTNNFARSNPFRYRGYYLDTDTGLYYLQSRYYDPEVGRLINADGYISTGTDILNNNMYSYCNNNPTNSFDHYIANFDNVYFSSKFNECIKNKIMSGADAYKFLDYCYVNNSNPELVRLNLQNGGFSYYKGVKVHHADWLLDYFLDSSFSFCEICIVSESLNNSNFSTILRHEYGHSLHYQEIGWIEYVKEVVIPSITINLLDRNGKLPYDYYSYPWEAKANELGGSNASQIGKPKLPPGGYRSYLDLIQLFKDNK